MTAQAWQYCSRTSLGTSAAHLVTMYASWAFAAMAQVPGRLAGFLLITHSPDFAVHPSIDHFRFSVRLEPGEPPRTASAGALHELKTSVSEALIHAALAPASSQSDLRQPLWR